MKQMTTILPMLSLVEAGALFGFFYAWVCSTMWGLDAADPRVAIAAMQAMNASVRNLVFAPVFFGTPIILALTALVLWRSELGAAAIWFALAAAVVGVLAVGLTMAVNVPMNEALAEVSVPDDIDAAREIWMDYSPRWQFWNQMRTLATGVAVLCIGIGLLKM